MPLIFTLMKFPRQVDDQADSCNSKQNSKNYEINHGNDIASKHISLEYTKSSISECPCLINRLLQKNKGEIADRHMEMAVVMLAMVLEPPQREHGMLPCTCLSKR